MNIKTAADLNAAIALLEVEVNVKKRILTDHYHATIESLRPATLIRGAFDKIKDGFHNMVESGDLVEKIVGTSLSFGAGLLSKKLLVGKPTNIFKRMLGTAVQVAVTSVVSKNADNIKEKGLDLLRKFTNNHNGQNK